MPKRSLSLKLLCSIGVILTPILAEAQFRPPVRTRELYIEVDEEGSEMLRRAKRYEKINDWALAVQTYDKILSDKTYTNMLFQDPKTKIITGLRAHVRALLLDLPPEGRHAYDLLRRIDAKLAWNKGKSGNIAFLQRVLTRYPASSYAGKAACRLAEISLEQGQLDQARTYSRVALSTFQDSLGDHERITAYRVWVYCEALSRKPDGIKHLIKKVEALAPKIAAELSKSSNRLFASLPKRVMGAPPALEKTLWHHSYPEYHSDSLAPLPLSMPYVYRDSVIFHNNSYAYSLNQKSGKLQWKKAIKPDAYDFNEAKQLCELTIVGSRIFISVDHDHIVALEASTGEVIWELSQSQLRQAAGVEFPLRVASKLAASAGKVYIPATTAGDNVEYRLLAFDGDSGRSQWSSLICSIRFGNPAPAFSVSPEGRQIFALTGDGVLTSLDSVDGSLVWLKEYSNGGKGGRAPVLGMSGGRLLVAPPELNTVFAYDPLNGKELARSANKGGPLILGLFRGSFIRLYKNGDLRTGVGGRKLITALGKNLPLLVRPRIVGKFGYLTLRTGLRIVDLSSGQKTFMKNWSGLELPGRVIPTADRIIAITPKGAVAYGLKSALAPVKWADDKKKKVDPSFLASCLGSDNFSERELATQLLLKLGAPVAKHLKIQINHRDPEISMRSEDLLFEFGRDTLKKKWKEVMRPEWIAQVPNLFDRLTHRNPKIRLDSLELVGKIEDRDILVLFQDLLADKNPNITLKAAKILYSKNNRKGIPIFETFLKTGSEKVSLEILAAVEKRKQRSGRREDLPLAKLAAQSKYVKVRVIGAGLLADLGDRLVIGDLKNLLADRSSEVKVAAIRALGDLGLDRVGPILAPLTADKARFVRFEAVKAMANLETALAAKTLCKACLDKDVLIARTAAEALLRIADSPASPKIPDDGIAKALDAKDPEVRGMVVSILRRRVNRPMKLLVRLALDKSENISRPALDEIYERAGPDDIADVSKIMKSPNIDVRFAAVQILGELGNPRTGPYLLKLLTDPDKQVRTKAASYLQQSANPQVVLQVLIRRHKAIEKLKTADQNATKSAAAMKALKGVSDKDVKYLVALSNDKKFQYALAQAKIEKATMADLIQNMDAETEAPGLILALRSKSLAIRQVAIKELEGITGVTRDYNPKDSEEKRKGAFESWSRWYFMHKTDRDVEDTIKALSDKKAKVRLDAAKALKNMWSRTSALKIVDTLKAEKLPWVAVEIDKILRNIFSKISGLPETPDEKAIAAAAAFWHKHMQELATPEKRAPPKQKE
jgi:HEAT repeat protein/outer membrane protein assembly factor BamB